MGTRGTAGHTAVAEKSLLGGSIEFPLLPTADSCAATLSRSPKKRTPDRRLDYLPIAKHKQKSRRSTIARLLEIDQSLR